MGGVLLGIDPGLTGAMAVVDRDPREDGERRYFVYDTPTMRIQKRNKVHHEYDLQEMHHMLVNVILGVSGSGRISAVIERAGPMSKEGVVSSFRSGYGVGVWHTLLMVSRISWREVSPATWKKALGLLGGDKNYSRRIAQQRFPMADLARVKDHGRAEALLIAEYGRQQNW